MAKWRPSKELSDKLKKVREMSAEEFERLTDSLGINEIHPFTGETALHAAVNAEDLKEVVRLVRDGADINGVNDVDLTPLMGACSLGGGSGMKIALRLIEEGADVNYVRKDDEMTALCFAAGNSLQQVVRALLGRGAKVEGPDGCQQTPLMHAARADNVAALKLLIAAGADINRACRLPWANGKTAEWLAEQEGATRAAKFLRSQRQASALRDQTSHG